MTNQAELLLNEFHQFVKEDREHRDRLHKEVLDALIYPRLYDKADRLIDLETK